MGALLAVEFGEQQLLGGIVVDIFARIDEAVAGAMLERNAPLPAGIASGRARVRGQRRDAGAWHRHCPSAWKPVAPVFVTGLQCLLDQQATEPRTVDEEI